MNSFARGLFLAGSCLVVIDGLEHRDYWAIVAGTYFLVGTLLGMLADIKG